MEVYVLMIFAYAGGECYSNSHPTVAFHSVTGFASRNDCEYAYNSLSPSGRGLTINHTCEQIISGTKIPDPLFIVPLSRRAEEPAQTNKNKPRQKISENR